MLLITHAAIDAGRLRDPERSRIIDGSHGFTVSWGVRSDRENAVQSACRVILTGEGFLRDSGWVTQKEQSLYCDAALPEAEPVRLSVMVRDDAGAQSEPRDYTIYNGRTAWQAEWIGDPDARERSVTCLRREFTPQKPVRSAVLYAAAAGYQRISLNGIVPDEAALDPAFTDYSRRCCYVVYPGIGKLLREGKNCLGVMLADGWRRNSLTHKGDTPAVSFHGLPSFSAMLKIRYTDGTEECIRTESRWQAGNSGITASDLFDGETFDARTVQSGWDRAGFSGRWKQAGILPAPGGTPEPMTLAPVLKHRTRSAVASWTIGGVLYLDFGQNLAGVVRITLPQLSAGQTVRIRHSEELDEDGTLFTDTLRTARAEDLYIASGDERDPVWWQPVFTYHGFRYISIECADALILPDAVTAVELHTDLELRSSFRCGDPRLTALHEACAATERANQHSILTDCPQRDERQGWMNDATVRFEETPYNFEAGPIFRKLTRDLKDTQAPDGAIADTAPFVWGNRPADPVCSSFLIAGYENWLHLGDTGILRENYDAYCAWERCLLSHSTDGIVDYGYYGDWAGPAPVCVPTEEGEGAVSKVTPTELMSTGYSYLNCRLLASFAEILGRKDDTDQWNRQAGTIRTAFLSKWYDAGTGIVCTGSQACQVFALRLGLIPEGEEAKVIRHVHEELNANGFTITTGNLCTRYLADMLTEYGYTEDVWSLLTKQTYPSYGYMLAQEATTIWERFELKKAPGMNSHNHPMYAAIDRWFYAYLCGIRPLKPAWEEFLVAPCVPKHLDSAQATVDTIRGEIAVRWTRRYGGLHLHVSVPFGAHAIIRWGGEEHHVGSGFHAYTVKEA